MNKKKRKDRPRKRGFPEAPEKSVAPSTPRRTQSTSNRVGLIILFLVIAFGGFYLQRLLRPAPEIALYGYDLVQTFPHDPTSFTQGLVLQGDTIFESTGKYEQSKLRKIELETGELIKEIDLDDQYFGEGLALVNDRLFQLTWQEGKCLVYDLDLNQVGEFDYEGQGWGLTYDGTHLILSDGTSQLQFFDPETFEPTRVVTVRQGHRRINYLNELEYSGGSIYANQWGTDYVYEINPETGEVQGRIDLAGLWPLRDRPNEGVMNGIAVDQGRVLVTGKFCPSLFEIKIKPVEQ